MKQASKERKSVIFSNKQKKTPSTRNYKHGILFTAISKREKKITETYGYTVKCLYNKLGSSTVQTDTDRTITYLMF